jgi:hypothetical protein
MSYVTIDAVKALRNLMSLNMNASCGWLVFCSYGLVDSFSCMHGAEWEMGFKTNGFGGHERGL